jgi:hypothetical protein
VSRGRAKASARGTASASRHRGRLAGALVALALVAAGCGSRAGGDPGNKRLHELSADPVLASAPPGATDVVVRRVPAHYAKPGFGSGGWHGPGVVVAFRSTAPPADVFGFYAQRAQAAGWRATGTGAYRLADTWTKSFPDGAAATLLLSPLTLQPDATERQYRLSAGIAPVDG